MSITTETKNVTWEEFQALRKQALQEVFGRWEVGEVQGRHPWEDYEIALGVDLEHGIYYRIEAYHLRFACDALTRLLDGATVDGEAYGPEEISELIDEEMAPYV